MLRPSPARALQQPTWPDPAALAAAEAKLSTAKPIVAISEIETLKAAMAAAAVGRAFVLQGGDCAENFAEANASRIRNKLRTILQMAVILTHGASLPIVKIGRMAGQYAKPRSADYETRNGITLPVYRGDMINGFEFDETS
ncbi:MAG: 3-deoxy-7-phosphoheptulonate synthase, partial [Cellulomonadaceae bacterium]|nr:3-deoxy-7-phosphoheptulonate synthase [Cellulomonadaceae bacterium]